MNEALRFERVADHNNAKTVSAALGISEERSDAIHKHIMELMKHDHDLRDDTANHYGIDGIMVLISEFVETPQELSFAAYAVGRLTEQMANNECPFHSCEHSGENPLDGLAELLEEALSHGKKKRHPLDDLIEEIERARGGERVRKMPRSGVIVLGGRGGTSLKDALTELFRR